MVDISSWCENRVGSVPDGLLCKLKIQTETYRKYGEVRVA